MGNFGKDRDSGRSSGKSFGGKPSFGGGSRGGKSFGGGDRGGRPSFGDRNGSRDGGRREERSTESFKAVCDSCHKSCEVPFRPTTGKPVYCNDCFAKNRDFDNRPSFGGRDSDRGGERPSFSSRNDRPARRDDKPSFSGAPQNNDLDGVKKQLETLSVKMETVLRTLEAMKGGASASKMSHQAPAEKTFTKAPEVKAVAKVKEPAKKEVKKVVAKKAVAKAVTKVAKKVVGKKK